MWLFRRSVVPSNRNPRIYGIGGINGHTDDFRLYSLNPYGSLIFFRVNRMDDSKPDDYSNVTIPRQFLIHLLCKFDHGG